jgi:hypothetical protein
VIIIVARDFLRWDLFGIFNHSEANKQQEERAKKEGANAGTKK